MNHIIRFISYCFYGLLHDCEEEAHFRIEDRFEASKRGSARITTLQTCKRNKENTIYLQETQCTFELLQ